MFNILIVDDDSGISEMLEMFLSTKGYNTLKALNGFEAIRSIKTEKIDLMLLDINMPNLSGYQVLKEIRRKNHIPVIIISARKDDSDKIIGLNLGADDYITKPFNLSELEARINAHLRRASEYNQHIENSDVIEFGEIKLDKMAVSVKKRGIEIELTKKEYLILEFMMSNPGRVFTNQQIMDKTTENDTEFYHENTVRVHIANLREKIEDSPSSPKYIVNIRGLGYKFNGESKKE